MKSGLARLLVISVLGLLCGCEINYNSSSDGGTRVTVSDTGMVRVATSTQTGNTQVKFDSAGL